MKAKANVYVTRNGYPFFVREGDDIPDDVTVTNPAVLGDQEPEAPNVPDTDNPTPDEIADGDSDEDEKPADEQPKADEPDATILPAPAPKRRAPAKKAQPASE